jgi:hypothetical protein
MAKKPSDPERRRNFIDSQSFNQWLNAIQLTLSGDIGSFEAQDAQYFTAELQTSLTTLAKLVAICNIRK